MLKNIVDYVIVLILIEEGDTLARSLLTEKHDTRDSTLTAKQKKESNRLLFTFKYTEVKRPQISQETVDLLHQNGL